MFPISSRPSVVDIHKSKAPQLYAAAITTYVLAVIAVALRFWARRLNKKFSIGVDDWTVTVALFVTTGYFVTVVVSLHQGFGEHYEVLSDNYAITFGRLLFAEEILYFAVIGLVKLSILAFYWRLFKPHTSTQISCYILGTIVLCWEIAVILVTVFQCVPVSGYWNKNIPSKCIGEKHFFLGYSIPNILTDFALLLLPASSIWQLQMEISHKKALAGTFLLGSFISVISIIRLVILLKLDLESPDLDYNYISLTTWSIAESNMAIVAACLPSLRPIHSRILDFYNKTGSSARSTSGDAFFGSWERDHPSAMVQRHKRSKRVTESLQDLKRSPDEVRGFTTMSRKYEATIRTQKDRNSRDSEDLEMQRASTQIQVKRDVDVTYEQKQNEETVIT